MLTAIENGGPGGLAQAAAANVLQVLSVESRQNREAVRDTLPATDAGGTKARIWPMTFSHQPESGNYAENADRNLLFGLHSLQNGRITREALLKGLQTWAADKSRSLADVLVEAGHLTAADRTLLEPLVEQHIRVHGDDPQQSLAALSSVEDAVQSLKELGDPDLNASLVHVAEVREVGLQSTVIEPVGCHEHAQDHGKSAEPLAADPQSADAQLPGSQTTFIERPSSVDSTPTIIEPPKPGGRFRIVRHHKDGGLGRVSMAIDLELGREVAFKEILPGKAASQENRARFNFEGEVTGKLEHPGIVPVYGLGRFSDGRPFYAMRFIRGQSLYDAIEEFHRQCASDGAAYHLDPLFRQLVGRLIDVCHALEYAHSKGVLHRDLKPQNVMLGKYGETLVVDWGLAKNVGVASLVISGTGSTHDSAGEPVLNLSSESGSAPTVMGQTMGTPRYMSPEQARGEIDRLGPGTDIYALGAILFSVLTNQPAIGARPLPDGLERLSPLEAVRRAREGEFPRPTSVNPAAPRSLEAVCLKAMSFQVEDRYGSAKLLADDLQAWLDDVPVAAFTEPFGIRLQRWMKRHRTAVVTGSAMFVMSFIGLIGWNLLTAEHSRELEKANQVLSDTNLQLEQSNRKEREATRKEREATLIANRHAADNARLAEQEKAARVEADLSADEARRQATLARRHLYIARMNLIRAASESVRIVEVHRLLDLYRPLGGQSNDPDNFRSFEWFYWDRWCHSELLTIDAGNGALVDVAFSPDGGRIAAAGGGRFFNVWDSISGRKLLSFTGHMDRVNSVAFSPDGRRLASASNDRTIRLWDAATGELSHTIDGHRDHVTSVSFSPDGERLVSGSWDHSVRAWNAATGRELLTFNGHGDSVTSVAISPDGARIASASWDKTVRVWDAVTGMALLTLTGHTDSVHHVTFSPNGMLLASASNDHTVKVWNPTTGTLVSTLDGQTPGLCVVFSPDGQRLMTCATFDDTIQIRDAASGRGLHALKGHTDWVLALAVSPDGKRIASAGRDGTLKTWDATQAQEALTLKGHTDWVHSVAFSPDGDRLASSSEDKTVRIWDIATRQELLTLSGHFGAVDSVVFSPDGRWLATSGRDRTVRIWDATTGGERRTFTGHTDQVTCVRFSPDGSRIASASLNGETKIQDAATGQELLTLKNDGRQLAFSPDGSRLASSGYDRMVKLWDAETGTLLLTQKRHASGVTCVAFSRDGLRLASAGEDGAVKIWDATTGFNLIELKGHVGIVSSVVFSPDGRRLASAGDNSIRLWDTETGQELLLLNDQGVKFVVFSHDGHKLASSSYDGTVKVWDATPRP